MEYQITNYPIEKAIDCMSGNSGLTEEFIYSTTHIKGQRYIVLSSATGEDTMMGEVPMCEINNKPLKVFENKEGLLVARNGRAGTTKYLAPGYYTINDHAYILSKKKNCPYEINLKWLAIQYKTDFLSYSSASDNGTWNKTGFFKNVTLDIPVIEEQLKIVNLYERAYDTLGKVQKIKSDIEKLNDREISFEYEKYVEKNVPVESILDCMSGNSGLTSELIYSTLHSKDKRYKVLSGATQEENYLGEIIRCEINNKPIRVFEDKEGLLVIRKGKAGKTKYLDKGKYTINDDAYILSIKKKYKDLVSLKWLKIQCRSDFMEYSSSSDNGTWNKTGFFKNVSIDIPELSEQLKLVDIYEKSEAYLSKLSKIEKELLELIDKEYCNDEE